VFLKRYEAEYLSAGRRLLRRLGWRSAQDEAQREWEGLEAVRALGIATATPVAFGQERQGGLVTRSFLMTAEIVGGVDGERYMRSLSAPERGPFLGRLAELAKRLHGAGWVHKDLYVSHVLVAPGSGSGAEPTLFLIDLQRLIQPASWRERWQVKDLGALAYSALKAGASPRDLLRAWQLYCGTKDFNRAQLSEARRVLRRVAWLKTRTPKHDKDFQQLK
jgi:tRNA A-37 threonylcarbamoyl transferase component Bud32